MTFSVNAEATFEAAPSPPTGDFTLITMSDPPTRAEVERLAQERWHTRPDWWIAGTTPKNLTDDALPTNCSYDSGTNTITISGAVSLIDGWDFGDAIMILASGADVTEMSNCAFSWRTIRMADRVNYQSNVTPPTLTLASNSTARLRLMRRCWFRPSEEHEGGPFSCARIITGTSATGVWPRLDVIEFCSFEGYGNDVIRSGPNGVRRYNFFDVGYNMPAEVVAEYDADYSYSLGEMIISSSSDFTGRPNRFWLRIATSSGTLGAPDWSSIMAENSDWLGTDPHTDHDQSGSSVGTLTFLGNFCSRNSNRRRHPQTSLAKGLVSVIRRNPYGGGSQRHGSIDAQYNIFNEEVELSQGGGSPISATPSALLAGETIIITNNWFNTAQNHGDIANGVTGASVTKANNQAEYDDWSPATLSAFSSSYASGALTYGYTATVGGWMRLVVSASSTPLTATQIKNARAGDTGVLALFEIDAPANTAVSRNHTVALTGTVYVHGLYQAGGGINTLAAVRTVVI